MPADLVTVIIPCFNQERFLSEAIESVLNQTHRNHEIVIVDDGSTDESSRVVARYPGVQYVRQSNQGPSAARNRGLEVARGPYIVFLDADDRLLPHHLDISLQTMRNAPEAGAVFGDYALLGSPARHRHECAPSGELYERLLRSDIIPCPAAVLIKRDVLLEVGGFRPELRTAEDYDLFLRIAARYPMICHHQVVAEYRQHDEQVSRRWGVMLAGSLHVLKAQSPSVRRDPRYREAYRAGIRHVQQRYGDPLLWHATDAFRLGRWQDSLASLRVLMCHYPTGLTSHVWRKLRRMAQRVRGD